MLCLSLLFSYPTLTVTLATLFILLPSFRCIHPPIPLFPHAPILPTHIFTFSQFASSTTYRHILFFSLLKRPLQLPIPEYFESFIPLGYPTKAGARVV